MPSWNWDEAATRVGRVDQSVANTDHGDPSVSKRGYDYQNFSEIAPTPVICYPFHESSGTTANDVSGSGNDGTTNGGVTWGVESLLGTTGAGVDGTDDNVVHPTLGIFDGSQAFAVSLWIRFNDVSGGWAWSPWAEYDWRIRIANDGNLDFATYDGSTETEIEFTQSPATGEIYHLGVAYGGSAMEAVFNGVSQGTASPGSPRSRSSSNTVGSRGFGGGDLFCNADLLEFRVYDEFVSESQFRALHDVVRQPSNWVGQGKLL